MKIKTLMSFSSRLILLRKNHNFSQTALANKVGIHQNVIGRYERGEARPSIELALKIANIFDVSLDYLVGKMDMEIDKDILNQVLTIQKLPDEERGHIIFTLKALLRDAKSRLAYAS